jgi:hypothetical protein
MKADMLSSLDRSDAAPFLSALPAAADIRRDRYA